MEEKATDQGDSSDDDFPYCPTFEEAIDAFNELEYDRQYCGQTIELTAQYYNDMVDAYAAHDWESCVFSTINADMDAIVDMYMDDRLNDDGAFNSIFLNLYNKVLGPCVPEVERRLRNEHIDWALFLFSAFYRDMMIAMTVIKYADTTAKLI